MKRPDCFVRYVHSAADVLDASINARKCADFNILRLLKLAAVPSFFFVALRQPKLAALLLSILQSLIEISVCLAGQTEGSHGVSGDSSPLFQDGEEKLRE